MKHFKIRRLAVSIFVFLVILILSGAGIFIYLKKTDQVPHRLGNFIFIDNKNSTHLVTLTGTNPHLNFCVDKSDFLPVGGLIIDSISRTDINNNQKVNNMSFEVWNNKKIIYSDDSVKDNVQKLVRQLSDLSSYTDKDKLTKITLQRNFASWKNLHINIDPWPSFLYCADNPPKIPILIQQIDSSIYDKAFYVEYFISPYGGEELVPSSELILNKQDDWLIFDGEYGNSPYFPSLSFEDKSISINSSCGKPIEDIVTHYNDWPSCAEKDWSQKYRDQKKIDKWINGILESIEYKPQ